jgi:RNA polymerase sigma-70 factor (ECF subfamily)
VSTDDQLLAAWAQGDAKAGEALIERHFDALFRFFEHAVPSHAEDLVQDTLAACVEARDRYEATAGFRAFVFGIARNKALMFWRTRGRRGTTVDLATTSLEDLGASPTQRIAGDQRERMLLAGLRRIPVEAQILLQLHYWESMAGPALARVFDVPEGTIRSRLRRAKDSLVAQMEALAQGETRLHTTVDNLDRWAASMARRRPDREKSPRD